MATRTYKADQISLPHAEMVRLRQAGLLSLGIDQYAASRLSNAGIKPKGTTQASYMTFLLLSYAAAAAGLYFAFTVAWWWGLVGFIAMFVISKGNIAGNRENVLDAAIHDPGYYEAVRAAGGWVYQIDETVAPEPIA